MGLLTALVTLNACSLFRAPEKEVVTIPTIVETPRIDAPIIRIVKRPDPIQMKDSDIVVVTRANLQEVIDNITTIQGEFVLYAMTASSFEALALNMEQIKQFIEEQNQIILYYEKAVSENNDVEDDNTSSQ